MTRQTTGGFEPRFNVTRADGKPCRPEARYIVLDYAGDPHAKVAVAAYAESIANENPEMATDLRDALVHPEKYPTQHTRPESITPLPSITGLVEALEPIFEEGCADVSDTAIIVGDGASAKLHSLRVAYIHARSLPVDGGRITSEWCMNMAKLELGHEVGAGLLAIDPLTPPPVDGGAK